MKVTTRGITVAKGIFQLPGVTEHGKVALMNFVKQVW